jgi:hypothetical protein
MVLPLECISSDSSDILLRDELVAFHFLVAEKRIDRVNIKMWVTIVFPLGTMLVRERCEDILDPAADLRGVCSSDPDVNACQSGDEITDVGAL